MIDSSAKPLRLYELVFANGRSVSPYVWRIRYALAHKDLAYESVLVGFTGIPKVLGGRFKTVPVLEHGSLAMNESWDIAEYLDRAFPERRPLFSGPAENAMIRLMDAWFQVGVTRWMARLYALDIYQALRPEDQGYYRQSREARFNGVTLEKVTAERAAQLPAVREALQPLRMQLSRQPFLGGAEPNYADYIALGAFQWVGSVATMPPLAADDHTLRTYVERGFDLYGGIGRDPRIRPLFD